MKQYIVDAFTDHIFSGNQAAICIMEQWIPESLMMAITAENNFSETAFAVKEGDSYHLRWFTPGGEIDLCGHATLGAAYVIMNFYDRDARRISFQTMSGELIVNRKADMYEMTFPAYDLKEVPVTPAMTEAIGVEPIAAYMGRDLLCILDKDVKIEELQPDMEKVKNLDGLLLHLSVQSDQYDCKSRSFAPKLNVVEDPVCGSGHCHIVPYWVKTLGKENLICYQASRRGGTLYCRQEGQHIYMSGKAALYSTAELNIQVDG